MDETDSTTTPSGREPELLCPGCAQKCFVDEERGMRCESCRGLLASGRRARAIIAKSIEQGTLDAPQGALSCARCADLLVPVDHEEHRFHACASCRLVWSPSGAAPSLPPDRKGKTLRFHNDRAELRPDGSAVVISPARMEEWAPKKRYTPRVQIENMMYQVAREVFIEEAGAGEGGRWRYELVPFDATKTMLLGPALQYDAWFVDARDGVVADLPSPVRTARRVLLAVVIAAPLIVAILYFKPHQKWFEEKAPAVTKEEAAKAAKGGAVKRRNAPPPPKVPPASLAAQMKNKPPPSAPKLPGKGRPPDPIALVPGTDRPVRSPSGRRQPPKVTPAEKPDMVVTRGSDGTVTTMLRVGTKRQKVLISDADANFFPLAEAQRITPNAPLQAGVPYSVEVEFPGGAPRKLTFRLSKMNTVLLGRDFKGAYKSLRGPKGLLEEWKLR